MGMVDTSLDLAFFVLFLTFSFNILNGIGVIPGIEEESYYDVSEYDVQNINTTMENYGLNDIPSGLEDSPYLFGGGIGASLTFVYDFITSTPLGLGSWLQTFIGYDASGNPYMVDDFVALINGVCFVLYIMLFIALIRGYYW